MHINVHIFYIESISVYLKTKVIRMSRVGYVLIFTGNFCLDYFYLKIARIHRFETGFLRVAHSEF